MCLADVCNLDSLLACHTVRAYACDGYEQSALIYDFATCDMILVILHSPLTIVVEIEIVKSCS